MSGGPGNESRNPPNYICRTLVLLASVGFGLTLMVSTAKYVAGLPDRAGAVCALSEAAHEGHSGPCIAAGTDALRVLPVRGQASAGRAYGGIFVRRRTIFEPVSVVVVVLQSSFFLPLRRDSGLRGAQKPLRALFAVPVV